MGLEGYLEDLGIGDILQIISLSKKSGVLTLKSSQGEGRISFLDGQVVRASSRQFPENLGQLLCREQLATEQQIAQILAWQQKSNDHRPLGELLEEQFQISREAIEKIVKRQIETIVFSFFHWREGSFFFQLEEPENYGTAGVNPFDFMLEKGISPQWLVTRGQGIFENGEPGDEAELKPEVLPRAYLQDEQELTLLKGMLVELENPFLGGGIILLILRFASEIMSRAVVFDVRGKQLVGLGQFGLSGLSAPADQLVRKMRLNVEADSVFARVLQEKIALKTTLGNTPSEKILREVLGGESQEIFLGPVLSDGKVVAMLYGDNYPHSATIASTKAFEVFLSQAGLAMEQALLQGPS